MDNNDGASTVLVDPDEVTCVRAWKYHSFRPAISEIILNCGKSIKVWQDVEAVRKTLFDSPQSETPKPVDRWRYIQHEETKGETISVKARPGTTIERAVVASVLLACEENKKVYLSFNNRSFVVSPSSLISCIIDDEMPI